MRCLLRCFSSLSYHFKTYLLIGYSSTVCITSVKPGQLKMNSLNERDDVTLAHLLQMTSRGSDSLIQMHNTARAFLTHIHKLFNLTKGHIKN